ncbi:MAG TPA: tRNA (adenosine(37)-N6)-threonylcarbamoyltransferase complex transferase subunit TsaD [Candidatus Saccharimonadales bacterium]|nr:tRNA (adenosine(37)-N6)-threonylcarbamoyltransferase complex transferase subunit TsaD [Candidatus Saccharimonadales bacterium]
MKILAIETSCDETAAAIVEEKNGVPVIISNVVSSQMKAHTGFGGVVPNLAARLHTENLPIVLEEVTQKQKLKFDAVAVTAGPGLVGCLLVGVAAAKTIAMAGDLPFYAINHLEGHTYSAWLNDEVPELPALVVIVSGKHTDLVLMTRHLRYQHLGRTRDDAAGEAFDKVARLLGLGYPGGPAISELAKHGDPKAFKFPIGLPEKTNLEFSFSGLKAAVAYHVVQQPAHIPEHIKADIAASFEQTVADTICRKTVAALDQHPEVKTVCLVGGVAANNRLRSELEKAVHLHQPSRQFIVAPKQFCTDNAAMVGAAALFHHRFGQPDDWKNVEADPNLGL